MSVWKVARLSRVSSLTGEPFPPDTEVVAALFGEEEDVGEDKVRGSGFVRKDYLASEVTDEMLAGAFCVWHTRTASPDPAEEKRLDLGMAREFLERLLREKDPERGPVMMTLALLLVRKRRLHLIDQKQDQLVLRWPKSTKDFTVPCPELTEADAEALQQDLLRLFDVQIEPPKARPAAEAEGAPESRTASEGAGDTAPEATGGAAAD